MGETIIDRLIDEIKNINKHILILYLIIFPIFYIIFYKFILYLIWNILLICFILFLEKHKIQYDKNFIFINFFITYIKYF